MQLQGVPAVITGGASGLGEGAARLLAEAGAKVAIFDVQAEKAAVVAEDIGGIAVTCDVTNAQSAEAAFAAAREAHGP